MSWEKHFVKGGKKPVVTQAAGDMEPHGTSAKFSSYLPEVYAGHPNRIQRYHQYEDMDRDSDVAAALDTIADFCTQSEEQNDTPFFVRYNGEPNETEIGLVKNALAKWITINDFRRRLWKIFRDSIKNGDAFFLRDPENGKWLWLDHFFVEMVKMDEDEGEVAEEYLIRNLRLNQQAKYATQAADLSNYRSPLGGAVLNTSRPMGSGSPGSSNFQLAGSDRDLRQMKFGNRGGQENLSVVNADHVIHLSMSAGMDSNWPFGNSILDPIFKVYRQKELLEDSIIIYRVQRAPERRVFYIDVGQMNPVKARAHIESIKNEIHQRRIPSRNGGTSSIDSSYNPLSILEDYYFSQTSEGRGSKVETLPGGDSAGDITDLSYFTKKMARGMRIPTSYLSLGDEEAGTAYNDGKLGSAMIQEFRFNKYCMRIQSMFSPIFDREFKRFMKDSGIMVEDDLFELEFNPPQNFTKYRQIEIDSQQVGVYQSVADNPKLSERFKLKRFLNLTDDEIIENEKQWKEENAKKLKKETGTTDAESNPEGDLSSIGVRPPSGGGGFGDFGGDDFGGGDEPPADGGGAPDGGGGDGGMGDAPPAGSTSPVGSAAPPPGGL